MAGNITNIAEANQEIGALETKLATEKEARTAAQSTLETAQADHTKAIEDLKESHKAEIEGLKGEHATKVTELTDQIEAKDKEITDLTAKVEGLEGSAQTAAEGAAKIVGELGSDPVEPEGSETTPTSKTPDELAAAWAEYRKIEGSQEKRAYYLKNIAPFQS